MLAAFKAWIASVFQTAPAPLLYMRLGPEQRNSNPLMMQFFTWDCLHETLSWWKHFEEEVPRLAELGVTQVWLPPPNKAAEPTGRGYDAYDLWDLGEFDQKGSVATRWGTREELLHACKVAQEHGIDILIDAVLNHKLGADRVESVRVVPVNPDNRLKNLEPPKEIDAWTSFEYPGRGDKYSTLRWNKDHFTGLDWDQKTRTKAIYRVADKTWSRNVDSELGNYDFLLGCDIDHRRPDVQEDFLKWGKWILETTGAVGFRLDAIKHIDRKFLLRWIQETRRASGRKDMFVVSEYWSGNLKLILPYIRAFKGETTFFDVPLHMNFHQASRERSRYDLRKVLSNTIVGAKPNYAVTFVDNHDTMPHRGLAPIVPEPCPVRDRMKNGNLLTGLVSRSKARASKAGLLTSSRAGTLRLLQVGDDFKIQAYAIILLRGYGYPCVFYGDLYPNKEGYNANTARNVALLMEARKKFAYGATQDYLAHQNCIGFVRKGDANRPGCAVILSNKQDVSSTFVHELRMNVGVENAGSVYRSFMTQHGHVEIDATGWGTFSCFANNVQVWVKG